MLRGTVAVVLALAVLAPKGRAVEIEVDFAMYQDPKIELPPPIVRFSPKLKPLWLEALSGPEVDLRRQAAHTIALAHQRGMPDLEDTAAPLVKAMDAPDGHPVVLLAAARALITLDARQTAPVLYKHAMRGGLDMSQLVEPALARWDYKPVRKVWLERLTAPGIPRRSLVLAIRGLALVGETSAQAPLRKLAVPSDASPDTRLEAAQALGRMQAEGLVDDARQLAEDRSPQRILNRLIAARLLSRHRGEAAESLLLELAVDPEPSVAAAALTRLLEIDPMLVIPVVERTIANDDANVRHLGAKALSAWATPDAVALLGPMLDDPHVDVRRYVRRSLVELAADSQLRDPVLQQGMDMLATERWRGLQQASHLLVSLDHKPAAGRLVELLDFERPEVFVTATWALRRLAVPAALDAMFDKAQRAAKEGPRSIHAAWQLRQLFEAFGQMKYMPSAPLLRELVPKMAPFRAQTRAAAVWALGHLYAGNPQADLARQLSGRLADVDSKIPEDPEVRRMSAITLGRMEAKEGLPTLRRFFEMEGSNSEVGYACAWAIHQITGEPIPEPQPEVYYRLGWFLEPID